MTDEVDGINKACIQSINMAYGRRLDNGNSWTGWHWLHLYTPVQRSSSGYYIYFHTVP